MLPKVRSVTFVRANFRVSPHPCVGHPCSSRDRYLNLTNGLYFYMFTTNYRLQRSNMIGSIFSQQTKTKWLVFSKTIFRLALYFEWYSNFITKIGNLIHNYKFSSGIWFRYYDFDRISFCFCCVAMFRVSDGCVYYLEHTLVAGFSGGTFSHEGAFWLRQLISREVVDGQA